MAAEPVLGIRRCTPRHVKSRRSRASIDPSLPVRQHITPAGYARYIGRFGALAVALGVGMAVATGQGVAIARADDTDPGSSDSSSTDTSNPSPDTTAEKPAGTAASITPSSIEPTSLPTADESPSEPTNTGPSVPEMKLSVSSGAEILTDDGDGGDDDGGRGKPADETDVDHTTQPAPPAPAAAEVGDAAVPGPPNDTSRRHDSIRSVIHVAQTNRPWRVAVSSRTEGPDRVDPTTPADQSAQFRLTAIHDEPAPPAQLQESFTATTFAARTTAPVAATPRQALLAEPATLVHVATSLVAAVLTPFLAPGPATPAQPPLAWALLAWVRREIDQSVLNLATPARPQHVISQLADVAAVQSPNLLVNPGAELGDPSLSGYSSVTVPGWTVTGTPTVIEYGTLRRFPWPSASPGPTLPAFLGFPTSNSAPPGSGEQFFGGGPVATSTLTQTVDLRAAASAIDAGTVPYELSADLGGFTIDPSATSITVDFLDTNGVKLGTGKIRPVTVLDRRIHTALLERETSGTIPVGTRSARVVVTFTDRNPVLGNYNNAYADNLSFTVGAALPAPLPPAPPMSTVGQLGHVFIVYMENKGFNDVVDSPNAPYLNSLIDTYGFGSNYYGLTHPSDPNYYPILGGSDFGINYNCPSNCFDQPNLADNIEAAGLTWAGYAEGGGGYTTPTDRLPFLAFSDIYNDPARVAAHLFDLTQLEQDLASPATTPNFVWFAADDATNMEGPLEGFGIVRWALSQLTPTWLGGHQYNVKAGDEWLEDTVGTIMVSPVWQDPTQKSAIFLTFDEDYNNISLGNGNEGNHIVIVVIPSPGAVASGMREGAFVADDYSNHYSLLRTIEESLGLPSLTNNDKYAQPMNEYWCLQSQCPPQPQDQPVRSPSGDRTSTNALIDDLLIRRS